MSVRIETKERLKLTRRDFTVNGVLALLVGYVITVSEACGSSSPSQPSTPVADVNGTISANHGHSAVVTGAQITAGTALPSINIQGTATHAHTIALSAADLANLKNRQTVTVTSTTDSNHSHTVTFTPA